MSVAVSASRNNLWTKEISFHEPGNLFPIAGMKDFIEKDLSARREKTITDGSLRKMEKKWFPLARKSVSIS